MRKKLFVAMGMVEAKRMLRQSMRRAADALPEKEKAAQAAVVFAAVESTPQFGQARTIALYWSLADELPTHEAARRWTAQGKRVVLPVVDGERMFFREYSHDGRMRTGKLSIPEPDCGGVVDPTEIELMIVPGVAFDREGHRLGRGKGFYDRYLHDCPAFTIGACFRHQMTGQVPHETHDQKVDMVISPQ